MDPRIARTRASLQEALFALARERPLDDITVADIADRAEVNRSTFYQHYSDKETLLADALDAVAEAAGAALPERIQIGDEPPHVLTMFLEHFDENAELYRQVLGRAGGVVVEDGPPEQVLGDPVEERTREFINRVFHIKA